MGCSPSVLLEHIHRDSSASQDKRVIKKNSATVANVTHTKKETNRSVVNRKSSLPLTPEDEPLDIHKPIHDINRDSLIPPNKALLQILLVFSQYDPVCDSLKKGAERMNFEVTYCDSYDCGLDEFQTKCYDLIFIDTRVSKLEYDTLCRSIRNTKGSQTVAMVAVTRKCVFEKDMTTIPSLLESGFNRCLMETTNQMQWMNELVQLKHTEIRLLTQQATTQPLFAALDKCRDIVIISDNESRMQYINSAGEIYMGYRYEDLLGKTLQEQLAADTTQMHAVTAKLAKGKRWTGHIDLRRKLQEPITVTVQAIPIACTGKQPTHFVFVIEVTCSLIDATLQLQQPICTIPRKGSLEVRSVSSEYNRRTSVAKLSALPLEAPITKIINLLTQAQDSAGSNAQLISHLDKVIEMLHNAELYSPQVKDDARRIDEPVATDLIGALLTNNPTPIAFSSRRSSNDSSVYRVTSTRTITKLKMPVQIKDMLDQALNWDFDVILLEDLSNKHPLLYLGITLFMNFDVPNTLNVDERTLYNFLILIESKYHQNNSYHNSTHAADVMQAVAGYLRRDRMKAVMEPLDEAVALIAAACHDIDHPGRSSPFLSNSDNPLAIMYNDITVLEMHHAAYSFKLTLGDDRVNIFKNLERDVYKIARQNIIDMILATEMTKHFEHLAKFVNVFSIKTQQLNADADERLAELPLASPENIQLVKRMMIKCADVSNPTRPMRLCVEWARRITEEYFEQTDEEKSKGMPVLMPMFDRATCSIPKAQIGFVDFIINDMVEAWNGFIDFPELVTYMRQNYLKWKEYDEKGFSTLNDIKRLQMTVFSPTNTTPTVAE